MGTDAGPVTSWMGRAYIMGEGAPCHCMEAMKVDGVESRQESGRRIATWSPATKRYMLTLTLIVAAGLVYLARGVLPLVMWAALFAFLLNPLVNALTRIYIPRFIATVVVYLLFLAALVLIPAAVIPLIIQQILAIPLDPQMWAQAFYRWFLGVVEHYMQGSILGYPYDLRPYFGLWLQWFQSGQWVYAIPSAGQIVAAVQNALSTATSLLVGATGFAGALVLQIVAGIFAFFLTMLYTFYLLLVAPRLRIGLYQLFPEEYHEEIAYLIDQISRTWRRYLRGQVFLCFVIFAMTWVGLTFIGMPGAFTLAVIAGVLEIVPNLGPVLATIPAVIAALIQGSTRFAVPNWEFALITLGLYVLIQQLENNFLVPRIVGSAVNVHPFLVLIGIVVGAQVYGVLGALLAAPILATLRILAHYVHARLLDQPPFPELLPAPEPSPPPEAVPPPPPAPEEVEVPPAEQEQPAPAAVTRAAEVELAPWLEAKEK